MARFTRDDDLREAQFTGVDLRGARVVDSYLNDAVLRGVDVDRVEVDAPWLTEEGGSLVVNGVDVAPYVDAELDRRFAGRSLRHSCDPDGLRRAWAAVERQWAATVERATSLPPGAVEESVGGEWSLSQTLRHLVMATDLWFGATVLGLEQPFHPVGLPNAEAEDDGLDLTAFSSPDPSFDEVLAARAGRLGMVRDYLASVTSDQLAGVRRNPWAPDREETVLRCLQGILHEEWEHHRYAVRDLALLRSA